MGEGAAGGLDARKVLRIRPRGRFARGLRVTQDIALCRKEDGFHRVQVVNLRLCLSGLGKGIVDFPEEPVKPGVHDLGKARDHMADGGVAVKAACHAVNQAAGRLAVLLGRIREIGRARLPFDVRVLGGGFPRHGVTARIKAVREFRGHGARKIVVLELPRQQVIGLDAHGLLRQEARIGV